jgi:hypothetical protein
LSSGDPTTGLDFRHRQRNKTLSSAAKNNRCPLNKTLAPEMLLL